MESLKKCFFFFDADPAPLPRTGKKTRNPFHPVIDESLRDVVKNGIETGLRCYLGDAAAHRASAEDADLGEIYHLLAAKNRAPLFQKRAHSLVIVGAAPGNFLELGLVFELGFKLGQ